MSITNLDPTPNAEVYPNSIIFVVKYHLITYGCQMNTADSEEMAQPLKDKGLTATADLREADIILMNTCTVRDQAEHRADSNIGRLRAWKEKDPHRILIVAGCAASRWGDSIKAKYPFIDLVSPATQIDQFPEAIAQVFKERWNWEGETRTAFENLNGVPEPERRSDVGTTFLFGDNRTAYVTIMRGCNYTCSYCIVPQVRGREMYRPMPQILEEIRQKAARGYADVMLLGQTVNSYHFRDHDQPYDFANLLRAVDAIPEVQSIRFMSPHPRYMRDNVIEAMKTSAKVARHVHLPVQSGADPMLERMRRLYTCEEYLSIVDKLRAAMPGILITTDVIVGFPGETESEFEQTLSLIRDVRFNGLFAFKYSPRPGTASALLEDDVLDEEKEARLQQVLALNEDVKATQRMAAL